MLSKFTNQYQLSKTLRFELRPVGKTKEFIEQKGLIGEDEDRAEKYEKVKEIIDRYHKWFIDEALYGTRLEGLEEYQELFYKSNKNEKEDKLFQKSQESLRKQIAKAFSQHSAWKTLFKKELIKNDLFNLPDITEDEKAVVKEFDTFTTYFTGFHENRANMYTHEDKHSAIAFRIVHENLPIFLGNLKLFKKIQKQYPEIITQTQEDLGEYLLGAVVEDMFTLNYFNNTLSQKYIDLYNQMIGGVKQDELKVQGFNEKINLYRQQNGLTKKDLPNLKPLHKQILSDRDTLSWLPEKFESQEELVSSIKEFYTSHIKEFECCDGKTNILEKVPELFSQTQYYDLSKIYIRNDRSLTDISQALFKEVDKNRAYSIIKEALWEINKPKKSKDIASDEENFFDTKKSKKKFFSVAEIQEALERGKINVNVLEYFINDEAKELIQKVQTVYNEWQQKPNDKEAIKTFLDALVALQHLYKPLNTPNDMDKDIAFYSLFDGYFGSLSAVSKLYDKVRNFMTKKPYSLEKFKLNFENKGDFLGGWVDSKTENSDNGTQYGGYLFRKKNQINEYDYFLGISSDKKLFRRDEAIKDCDYERLDYYQPKSTSIYGNSYIGNYTDDKQKLIQAIEFFVTDLTNADEIQEEFNKVKSEFYSPSALMKILENKFYESYSELIKDENFRAINHEVCNTFQQTFKTLTRIPSADKYSNKDFKLFTEAQDAIEEMCQDKIFDYFPISNDEMDNVCERDNKTLYLFKISNKDLSYAENFIKGKRKSRGRDNLHTMLFKALMEGNQDILDIGTGEIFFRPTKYNDKVVIHKANEPIKNKDTHNVKKESVFTYDITKNKRFLENKYQFHLSIIQNYKQPKQVKNFENKVHEAIKDCEDIKIIGIDRGERHLLYLSLINGDGKIVEQYTLNQIINSYNGKEHTIDYHEKLAKKEDERDKARKEWGVIENIKELKEGYMSHVIHRIATLILEHNAIVVLEDLNFGFKRGRFKVEKQVYQKFEKTLIDKLNYLVDKKRDKNALGGVLNALQLTNKFQSFEKMGKQNGFLFYVPAWNTSKIDPVTGFVNLFDTRYSSVEKAKEFFKKFKSISYNKDRDYFEFKIDNYTQFNPKAEGTRQDWTICTYGERIKTFRNKEANSQWDSKTLHLTTEFKNLFCDYGSDLKSYILSHEKKEFFEQLLYLFKLTLQMRNSVTGTEIDYMISPVADKNGVFYDSRKVDNTLPKDADANGAYNIARKGLMLVERIKEADLDKKLNLTITNKEWLQYAQRG